MGLRYDARLPYLGPMTSTSTMLRPPDWHISDHPVAYLEAMAAMDAHVAAMIDQQLDHLKR